MQIVHIPRLLTNKILEADVPAADSPQDLYFDFYGEIEKENLPPEDGHDARTTINGVGQLLLDILALKRDESQPVGTWISQFSTGLRGIDSELINAKLQLARLQVYLEEQAIKEAEIKLLAECSTVRNLFGYYAEHIAEQDVRSAVLNKFQTVNSASHVLRSYSFATVYTVAMAYMIELELMRLLDVGNATIRNVSGEYCLYFRRCLDDTLNGSLGSSFKAANNSLVLIEQEFTPGNKGRMDRGWGYISREQEVCRCAGFRCESDHYSTIYYYSRLWRDYVIEGSLAEGFTGRLGELVQKDALGRGKPADLTGVESAAHSAAAQYLQSSIMPRYINANKIYGQMKGSRDVLAEAVAHATQYRDFSCSLAS